MNKTRLLTPEEKKRVLTAQARGMPVDGIGDKDPMKIIKENFGGNEDTALLALASFYGVIIGREF